MGVYQCENCKKEFNAREADRKRGWARFCSKSCKAVKQEKRTGQMSAYLIRGHRGQSSNNRVSRKDDGGAWMGRILR